jgi:hypothetical protein
MRISTLALMALAFAAASPSAVSGSASSVLRLKPTSSVALPRGYVAVVADGGRAAAVGDCAIRLWRPSLRTTAYVKPCLPRLSIEGSTSLDTVVLAGDRLAWLRDQTESHGQQLYTQLVVKTGSQKPREVVSADLSDFATTGGQLISLAGSGNTLAFGWTYSNPNRTNPVEYERIYRLVLPSDLRAAPCPDEGGGFSSLRLCSDTAVYGNFARSAADGRVLVDYGDGDAEVIEPDNTRHRLTFPYKQATDELALSGSDVVVVRARGTLLSIYDATNGTLMHSWPIARATGLGALTVAGGYAVFEAHGLHLVQLSTGRELMLLAPGGKSPLDASVTSKGLFVVYRVGRHTRLGFVPLAGI